MRCPAQDFASSGDQVCGDELELQHPFPLSRGPTATTLQSPYDLRSWKDCEEDPKPCSGGIRFIIGDGGKSEAEGGGGANKTQFPGGGGERRYALYEDRGGGPGEKVERERELRANKRRKKEKKSPPPPPSSSSSSFSTETAETTAPTATSPRSSFCFSHLLSAHTFFIRQRR